jgi:hypothetical protein
VSSISDSSLEGESELEELLEMRNHRRSESRIREEVLL